MKMRNFLCAVGWSFFLPACADRGFIVSEEYEVVVAQESEQQHLLSTSCMRLGGGVSDGDRFRTGSNGPNAPQYSVKQFREGNGVKVVVSTKSGDILESRTYSDGFLESGKRDVFRVHVEDKTYEFIYWGAENCSF